MTEKKSSWDEIPSLEGLEIDWDFVPVNPLGKRSHGRLTVRDLYPLFHEKEFPVRIKPGMNQAYLMDVSEGGMSVRSNSKFLKGQEVLVSFSLGNVDIVANGIVRMVREVEGVYLTGIQFEGLTSKSREFIMSLYSSAKILRGLRWEVAKALGISQGFFQKKNKFKFTSRNYLSIDF